MAMQTFVYGIENGVRSLTRSRLLSCQIILAMAFGIAAFSSAWGALLSLTGDPLKDVGRETYHPQVDPRPLDIKDASGSPPDDLTLRDARAIFQFSPSGRRAMSSLNWLPMEPVEGQLHEKRMTMVFARGANSDFFKLFRAHFAYGSAWSSSSDNDGSEVVVISKKLNLQLFGGKNSIGNHLQLAGKLFTIIGILNDWEIVPRVYDLNDGAYAQAEDVFMPFETWLDLPQDYGYGPMKCWANEQADMDHNPRSETCTWVQLWVRLFPSEVAQYVDLLKGYSEQQRALGRFQRSPNVKLKNADEWLVYKKVVPDAIKIQLWVAFGLLAVCLVSTSALLGVKFRGDFSELGIRRALGASKRQVFLELLSQGIVIGMLGGIGGIGLGLAVVRIMKSSGQDYAQFLGVSFSSALFSLIVALCSALVAAVVPAYVAANESPYKQMVGR